MTYRERRLARAEKLSEWADKRVTVANATLRSHEKYRGDHAFNFQPGHIPERARVNRQADAAFASLEKASSMASRAANIEAAVEHAIYDDDPDAIERLEAKLAKLEDERERNKAFNKTHVAVGESRWRECRVGKKVGQRTGFVTVEFPDGTVEEHPRSMIHPAMAGYMNANLNGNITRVRERIKYLKARKAHEETRSSYEAAGATVADSPHPDYIEVAYPERPSRDRIDELKAAGFWWKGGAWHGPRANLPARYQQEAAS